MGLFAVALPVLALLPVAPADAETLDCQLTTYSAAGVKSTDALKELLPERTRHEIEGDTSRMAPFGWTGSVTREPNRVKIQYLVEMNGDLWKFHYTFIPSSNRLTARIDPGSRYMMIPGGQGVCAEN